MSLKDKEGFLQKIIFGIGVSLAIFIFLLFVYLYFSAEKIDNFQKVNEFGDAIAGFAAPITIIFLILNYVEQNFRLKEAERENYNSSRRSEFASFGGMYFDIMKNDIEYIMNGVAYRMYSAVIELILKYERGEIQRNALSKIVRDIVQREYIINYLDDWQINYTRERSYFEAYRLFIHLHADAFYQKKMTYISDIFRHNSPFDATAIGVAGRRLAYVFELSEILDDIDAGRFQLTSDDLIKN